MESLPSTPHMSPRRAAKRPRPPETTPVDAPQRATRRWQETCDAHGIPTRMLCPISHSLMIDPVVASDHNVYDRPNIARVLRDSTPKSPLTREPLRRHLVAIAPLQREIEAFLEHNAGLKPKLNDAQKEVLSEAQALGIAKHQALAALVATYLSDGASLEEHLQEMPLMRPKLFVRLPMSPFTGASPPRTPPAGLLAQGLPSTPDTPDTQRSIRFPLPPDRHDLSDGWSLPLASDPADAPSRTPSPQLDLGL